MNYNKIKSLAKAKKCTVKDLLALAPQNDPFYVGQRSQLELAAWFKGPLGSVRLYRRCPFTSSSLSNYISGPAYLFS